MGKILQGWPNPGGLTTGEQENWGVTPDTLAEPETATPRVL